MQKQFLKLDNKEFIRYLSPDLEELFRACVQLEKMYEKFRFIEKHDLMPTVDMIWETITIADRIMGMVKSLVMSEKNRSDSIIDEESYNLWKKSWDKYDSELRKLKERITGIGIGGREEVKLKVVSFLADYVSFIRANVYPVFLKYAEIISLHPQLIYRVIDQKFVILFVRRFIRGKEVEEEEE